MTRSEAKPAHAAVKELFAQHPDGLREVVRAVVQEVLEAEMTEVVGAAKESAARPVWATVRARMAARR